MGVLAKLKEGEALSDQQRAFVEALLAGASNSDAMKVAAYSETVSAWQVLRSGSVQAALRAGRKALLDGELKGDALKAMRELLSDQTPAATRFQAAKWVLEHGEAGDAGDEKPLSEMTPDELEALVARLEEAREARMIDVTPSNGAQPG